jgi:hypothetical protein
LTSGGFGAILQVSFKHRQEPIVAVVFINIRSLRTEYRPRVLGCDTACSLAAPARMLSD